MRTAYEGDGCLPISDIHHPRAEPGFLILHALSPLLNLLLRLVLRDSVALLDAADELVLFTVDDGQVIVGVTDRLWGIDAPEIAQTCADGWPAG